MGSKSSCTKHVAFVFASHKYKYKVVVVLHAEVVIVVVVNIIVVVVVVIVVFVHAHHCKCVRWACISTWRNGVGVQVIKRKKKTPRGKTKEK